MSRNKRSNLCNLVLLLFIICTLESTSAFQPTLLAKRSLLVVLGVSLNRHHKFDISQHKVDVLFDKIESLSINLSEVEEKFVRGSGAGGQKINKTSSCVQMTHKPTGLQVSCQREREREKNRFIALRTLVEKIELQLSGGKVTDDVALKKRKQKARRQRRNKGQGQVDGESAQEIKKGFGDGSESEEDLLVTHDLEE